MQYVNLVAVLIAAYLIGSVSGAILLSRVIDGKDIRKTGSNNAGTTNMLRTYGKKAAVITLIVDILKGVLAVLLGILIENKVSYWYAIPEELQGMFKYGAALFVVLGHIFPLYFKFKGGKGVATSIGAILCLDWKIGLIVLVTALLIMVISKYVSLGSIIGAVIFPVLVFFSMVHIEYFSIVSIACSIAMSVLVILKHSSNIKRLVSGTENKLSIGKK